MEVSTVEASIFITYKKYRNEVIIIQLQKGDKVKVKTEVSSLVNVKGKTGTIVSFISKSAKIEFDEYIGGHSCDGLVKQGYGWIVSLSHLEKATEPLTPQEDSIKAYL